jgi:RsmE family RNA methyltransferase
MNRILFERGEIVDGEVVFAGERADHVIDVLHGEAGQTLKTGEIDGLVGTSTILEVDAAKRQVRVKVDHGCESVKPWVDLVLAPPRPRVLKRLLPQLAALGVGRIFLVGAKKVEKAFWGATLLKDEISRGYFVDGLMQAGTSIMPKMEVRRNFARFLTDELDREFPDSCRIVAHPYGADPKTAPAPSGSRLLIAIGPEGGWCEEEVELLESRGFARYSLGPRILRTDTAVVALLAKFM